MRLFALFATLFIKLIYKAERTTSLCRQVFLHKQYFGLIHVHMYSSPPFPDIAFFMSAKNALQNIVNHCVM